MSIKTFFVKIWRYFCFLQRSFILRLFQWPRKLKFSLLSNCRVIKGNPIIKQPALISGSGQIIFGENVILGVAVSPGFLNGYIYLDSRNENSKIIIEDEVQINNNFCAICEGEEIRIGRKTLIGYNVEIIDSDFHELTPDQRLGGNPIKANVFVGKNVFIGSNVRILKGVVIGDNCVIANSSVVVKSLPPNTVAAGVPAKVIRTL